jgi:hypothetical protein
MTVLMLVLLGFGFQNQAIGQPGLNGLICPGLPDTTGWLELLRSDAPLPAQRPDVSAGLIGTVEFNTGGLGLVGGLDWLFVNETHYTEPDTHTSAPTNETGSQLASWWTQLNGRNTYHQVTNNSSGDIDVHVRIYNEGCQEIRNFCDHYTPFDTHEYNFGDLFSNAEQRLQMVTCRELKVGLL